MLGDLHLPERHRVLLVALRKADGRLLASPDRSTKIEEGDIAIVVGKPSDLRRFAVAASR
jgi:uncharacterized protein with PhoU and TrkA domain